MDQSIVVIAEHLSGKVEPITYELAACAGELGELLQAPVTIVILDDKANDMGKEISADTGLKVIAIQVPGLSDYHGEAYREILQEQSAEMNATFICIAHTSQGLDFAPGLAVRLGAACITGVERISQQDGQLRLTRSMYNGKLVADLCPEAPVTVCTVQPGSFPRLKQTATPCVEERILPFLAQNSWPGGMESPPPSDSALTEAKVIVAAGRGISNAENLAYISRLAALFPRSAVAGSRPACDQGWLEYNQQVGVTGTTVTPKLYIACGISGAAQHLSGMRGAGFVVAINTDADAAFFNAADICIVEDLTTFIPLLLAEQQRRHSETSD